MTRTIDEYMALNYRMEIVKDTVEEGYVVSFPELPGCLTCGDTLEEAISNAEDAKRTWFEATIEAGMEIREPDEEKNYSGQFKLRIPKRLHRILAENARLEGVSLNQYCLYLLSENNEKRTLSGVNEKKANEN